MRPVALSFQCFGPYRERQSVDFTELERNGLFLICGETGAGKTTILDAMCIALYGRASGETRGELTDMRCKLAGPDDVTEVTFDFDSDGRRYRFERRLRLTKTREVEEHQCLAWADGVWRPLLANGKKTAVNARAEEIIGLTYDQFRQVMLLPQGQFERLLTSKSDEKEEILTRLFHAERWERAADIMAGRVNARDAALKERLARITARLGEFGCAHLPELAAKAEQAEEALRTLTERSEAASAEEKRQKARKEQALLDDREFADLAKREQALTALQARRKNVAAEEHLLSLADEAERLRPAHEAFAREAAALQTARDEANAAQQRLNDAAKRAGEARRAREAHERERSVCEAKKAQLVLLENARPLYAALRDKRRLRDDMQARQQEAARAAREAGRVWKEEDTRWQRAVSEQQHAQEAHRRALNVYLRGIGGILAQKLVEDEPCPVCGSRTHPAPAALPEEHVTDAELDALTRAENRANNAEVAARQKRNGAEQAKAQADQAAKDAEIRLAAARADCESAEAGKLEGIETAEALEQAIAAAVRDVRAFEEADCRTEQALRDAESVEQLAWAFAETRLGLVQSTEASYGKAREDWNLALASSALTDEAQFAAVCMPPEERQRRRKACAAYSAELQAAEAAVREKREALQGKTAPDMDAVNRAVDAAEQAAEALRTQRALEEKTLGEMRAAHRALTAEKEAYDAERSRVDQDLTFVRRVKGGAGVSLRRYVLGVRFAAVTAEANRLLATVYGGRYRLYRTDEASGRTLKKGLELEVLDVPQNQRRSVHTLSGGEKFLVALSLAVGLSSVIRASGGGVRMEAMFVDEGFGSLDDKAVDDAVEILQGVRRQAGAVVGVISHVSRLAETIPTVLEVQKTDNGSRILVRG